MPNKLNFEELNERLNMALERLSISRDKCCKKYYENVSEFEIGDEDYDLGEKDYIAKVKKWIKRGIKRQSTLNEFKDFVLFIEQDCDMIPPREPLLSHLLDPQIISGLRKFSKK